MALFHPSLFRSNIELCICTTSSATIHLSLYTEVASLSLLLYLVLLWSLGCRCLLKVCFSLDLCLGMELLGHLVLLCLVFMFSWRTTILLCYVLLCCVLLRYVLSCCFVTLCYVIVENLHIVMVRYIIVENLHIVLFCCVMLCYIMFCYVMVENLHIVLLCCVTLCFVMLCHVMLCSCGEPPYCFVLFCCVMLCCIMSCYVLVENLHNVLPHGCTHLYSH